MFSLSLLKPKTHKLAFSSLADTRLEVENTYPKFCNDLNFYRLFLHQHAFHESNHKAFLEKSFAKKNLLKKGSQKIKPFLIGKLRILCYKLALALENSCLQKKKLFEVYFIKQLAQALTYSHILGIFEMHCISWLAQAR